LVRRLDQSDEAIDRGFDQLKRPARARILRRHRSTQRLDRRADRR